MTMITTSQPYKQNDKKAVSTENRDRYVEYNAKPSSGIRQYGAYQKKLRDAARAAKAGAADNQLPAESPGGKDQPEDPGEEPAKNGSPS